MHRQLSSRNQRSRGFKVKHALQIFLLVAVCLWLIYQVKHSHDKKKEFDDNDARISQNINKNEILKLGRKDLHPEVKETIKENEKHEEEAEEDIEEVDIKVEEKEDEVKENGDEELDEHDQEKHDAELDHEEEFIDDEKELEEASGKKNGEEVTEKDGKIDTNKSVDNLDRSTKYTQDAREEQYTGDDASSSVTHEGQTISSESESNSMLNQINISGNENKGDNNTIVSHIGQNSTDITAENGTSKMVIPETASDILNSTPQAENGTSSIVIPENVSQVQNSTFQGSTLLNSTVISETVGELNLSNDTVEENTESHDLGNGTEIGISDPNHAHNENGESKNSVSGSGIQTVSTDVAGNSSIPMVTSQFDSNSTASNTTGNVESSNAFANISDNIVPSKHTVPSNASAETKENVSVESKDISENHSIEESRDVHQNELLDLSAQANGNYSGLDSSSTDNATKLQNETDDVISMEDKLAHLDLETLPDVRIKASSSEEAAEE